MQVITAEDIEKHFNYNPFDATKVIKDTLENKTINILLLGLVSKKVSFKGGGHT